MPGVAPVGRPIDPAGTTLIGRTAVAVSALSLGGSALGGLYTGVDEAAAVGAVQAAFAAGLRYLDVAPWYGLGLAEERLGRVLSHIPRASYTLSTKVGRLLVDADVRSPEWQVRGAPMRRAVFDFSRDGILRSLEASLTRLCVDRVDLLYLHDPDDHWDEALTSGYPTLAELKAEGVIGAIGVGMNQTEMLARFVEETDIDAVLCAGRYTLLDRSAGEKLLPLCFERRVSVVIGGVFNSGILADPYASGARYDYRKAPLDVVARAQRLARICQRHDVPLIAAALQFPARHPAVASVLIGVRSPAEVETNVGLAALSLDAELWAELAAGSDDAGAP